ncbi:baseplate wedge subunit and tail pin [Serratia phage 4S]|nr:baseplate wedge subunit and tail pin [Serratia phage 4S]
MKTFKTSAAAKVTSRNSDHIDFNLSEGTIIGGKQPVGAPTIRQTTNGVDGPTVQGAIDDLITLVEIPIDGCLMTWGANSPQAISQTQRLDVSGVVVAESEDAGPESVVHVYGFPFKFPVGTTANNVTTAIFDKFKQLQSEDKFFQTVSRINDVAISVTFIDRQNHEAYNFVENGVTVATSITQPASPGYGTWELVKADTTTFPGKTLNYYRRIA